MGNSNGYARDDLAGTWRILGEWLNLYATIVALGVLNLFGVAALPNSLDVLSDPAVLGIVGFMYLVEFFADKTQASTAFGMPLTHSFVGRLVRCLWQVRLSTPVNR